MLRSILVAGLGVVPDGASEDPDHRFVDGRSCAPAAITEPVPAAPAGARVTAVTVLGLRHWTSSRIPFAPAELRVFASHQGTMGGSDSTARTMPSPGGRFRSYPAHMISISNSLPPSFLGTEEPSAIQHCRKVDTLWLRRAAQSGDATGSLGAAGRCRTGGKRLTRAREHDQA
jgi:hypothetical protein